MLVDIRVRYLLRMYITFTSFCLRILTPKLLNNFDQMWYYGNGKVHPCTSTEALYRPYGP